MRIGIDCRVYSSSHGYMGKYMEDLVSFLIQNTDAHECVLFFNDRELADSLPKSPRLHIIKTIAKVGSFLEQILFPYELYREKLDILFFPHPFSPWLYRKKYIILLSDLLPYFYPEKRFK